MKTVAKAINILKLFTEQMPSLGVIEISRATSIDKATVHRILRTFIDEEFVVQNTGNKKYSLGPAVLGLANNYISQSQPFEIARPFLAEIWEQTDETIHFCIRQGTLLFLNYVLESRQAVRVASHLGEQTPLHCTAGGKVFLAYSKNDLIKRVVGEGLEKYTPNTITNAEALIVEIKQIKKKGYGLGLEEYGLGFCSVAVPVFDLQENCIAAISVALPLSRSSKKRLRVISKILIENSRSITSKMMP
jgi:IclR family KDG regulon transcriptional repressor